MTATLRRELRGRDERANDGGCCGLLSEEPFKRSVTIDPDNISNKDWVILLEAGTIIGPSPQRIRVARWMQEKKIVKKYDMFLRTKYFIVVEGYNPRIHALYFCPQLFRHDSGKLVPLEGEDVGRLIARAVEASATERRPWYEPTEKLPQEPLINSAMLREFDTLVVEMPARELLPAGSQQLLGRPMQPAEALDPARWFSKDNCALEADLETGSISRCVRNIGAVIDRRERRGRSPR